MNGTVSNEVNGGPKTEAVAEARKRLLAQKQACKEQHYENGSRLGRQAVLSGAMGFDELNALRRLRDSLSDPYVGFDQHFDPAYHHDGQADGPACWIAESLDESATPTEFWEHLVGEDYAKIALQEPEFVRGFCYEALQVLDEMDL